MLNGSFRPSSSSLTGPLRPPFKWETAALLTGDNVFLNVGNARGNSKCPSRALRTWRWISATKGPRSTHQRFNVPATFLPSRRNASLIERVRGPAQIHLAMLVTGQVLPNKGVVIAKECMD